jgi:hypothetical protein
MNYIFITFGYENDYRYSCIRWSINFCCIDWHRGRSMHAIVYNMNTYLFYKTHVFYKNTN